MVRVMLLVLVFGVSMFAADLELRIADYKGDRQAAISLTFDDGWKGQVENTLAIIDPIGIKGTFFFMPHAMEKTPQAHATWADAKAMQANGHEIGTHDKVKPKLHELDKAALETKINTAYQLIADKTGVAPVCFALPGGSQLSETVKEVAYQRHAFVRKPNTFPDIAEIPAYGNAGKKKWNLEREQGRIEDAITNGKWRIPVIHAIVKGYAPFPSKDAFRVYCEWLHAQRDRIWIAPMGTVARYIQARKTAKFADVQHGKNTCSFTLSVPDELRELCTEALSVLVSLPDSGADITVTGGTSHKLKDDVLVIDVIPDGRTVKIVW